MAAMVYADGLNPFISREAIELAIKHMAADISKGYQHKNPLVLGVLRGSFVFMSDLLRQLDFPLEVDFVCCSSYQGTESCGRIDMTLEPRAGLAGRHVLLVEDIVDTGLTLAYLVDNFRKKHPASLKVCALLDKPSRRQAEVAIDYKGFTVPDKFIVGYGLDCDQQYRNLPELYTLHGE
jgi:hypoxanthine phosphoribosyltransferase